MNSSYHNSKTSKRGAPGAASAERVCEGAPAARKRRDGALRAATSAPWRGLEARPWPAASQPPGLQPPE